MDIADEIQRLSDLHQKGALTDSEFAAAKAAVLSAHTSGASPPTPTKTDESSLGEQPTPSAKDYQKELSVGCSILLLALCLVCGGFPWWSDVTYSEGERVGVIVKFSHKGVIWKSWEGEMQLGGVKPTEGGVVPNLWAFSLRRGEEEDLVQKVMAAQESGKRVKMRYRQALCWAPWRGFTGSYLKSVDVLGE